MSNKLPGINVFAIIISIVVIFISNISQMIIVQSNSLEQYSIMLSDLNDSSFTIEDGVYIFDDTEYKYSETKHEFYNGVVLEDDSTTLYVNGVSQTYDNDENEITDLETFYNNILTYRFTTYLYIPVLLITLAMSVFRYIVYLTIGFVLFKIIIYFVNRVEQKHSQINNRQILKLCFITCLVPIFCGQYTWYIGYENIMYIVYVIIFLIIALITYKNKKIGD